MTDENGGEKVARAMEIAALDQITSNLERINRKMDDQVGKMNELNLRLDRIENSRIGKDVENIHASLNIIGERLTALEAESLRRAGAMGITQVILKSPALGWLVGAAITAWAFITEKVTI